MKKGLFTFLVCLISSWLLMSPNANAQTTVTLGAVKDNSIYASATSNSNGVGDDLLVGNNSSGNTRRGLIKFDLSSIPSNAVISDAKLKLEVIKVPNGGSGTQTISLHALTADWGEGTSNAGSPSGGGGTGNGTAATVGDATWADAFFNTTAWATAGGDYTSTASASTSVIGTGNYQWTGMSLMTDVQNWVSNGSSNHGWIVIGNEGANKTIKHFGSKDNATTSVQPELEVTYTVATPLSGTYTIGGAGADYATFNAAVTDLNTLGVSGAVTFNIAAGTYTEFLTLTEVTGASAMNTITFDGSNQSMVTLTHDGTTQEATIYLDGADYFTFKNIGVVNTKTLDDAWGFKVSNQADFNTIENCSVTMAMLTAFADIVCISASSSLTSSSSGSDNFNNLTITDCDLIGGYYAVRAEGGNASTPVMDTALVINNCKMQDNYGYGVNLDDQEGLVFTNNEIFGAATASKDGIGLDDIINFTITGNTADVPDYGLELDDGNFDGAPTGRSLIANNMLISSGDDGMHLDDAVDIDVFHNTVVTTSSSASQYGLFLNDDTGLDVRNNIFVAAAGHAIYVLDATSNATIDYNIYYSPGANLAFDGTLSHPDLASWQTAQAARNVNSIEGNPTFVSATDLHMSTSDALANDVGDNTVGITVDIDGDTRPLTPSTTVDIGADEYAFAAPLNPTVEFAMNMVSVGEDVGTVTLDVTITNANANPTSVDVSLGMASTATSGVDFTFTSPTTVTFPANSTMTQTVSVVVTDDMMQETDETIILELSNSTNGAAIGTNSAVTITVTDNDAIITNALVLTGIYDVSQNSTPKGYEFYVVQNIPDLSVFGIGAANNGNGTDGQEYTFPAVSATAGDYIYVASDTADFSAFFGIYADFEETGQGTSINGDDAIEIFENGQVIDLYGDINVDGSGTAWDYEDSWAYRNCSTGPDTTFVVGDWTIAPINTFDNQTSNATTPLPMPLGTYLSICPQNIIVVDDVVEVSYNTTVSFNPLTNDNIPNTITNGGISINPTNGGLTFNIVTQLMEYTPNNGFCGTDTAEYFICDVFGCDTATIAFNIECPIPAYDIATVVTVDADGNPDSLGVACELQGIVYGIDFRGGNGYSFTLIDATDGINVFDFNDVPSGYVVAEGDEIRAVGEIGFFNGLTELLVDSIEFISAGNTLKTPTIVTTLDESTESDLIKLEAVTLVDPSQWDVTGASFNVDVRGAGDTLTIRIDSDCDIAGQPAPTGWFNVTGLGGQFDNSSPYTEGYQIFPRYQADIELISNTNHLANLEGQVRFFPNPTSGMLTIVSEIDLASVRISNILGQEMMTVNTPNATSSIDVSQLAKGVYTITFTTENGVWTEQFVKR